MMKGETNKPGYATYKIKDKEWEEKKECRRETPKKTEKADYPEQNKLQDKRI